MILDLWKEGEKKRKAESQLKKGIIYKHGDIIYSPFGYIIVDEYSIDYLNEHIYEVVQKNFIRKMFKCGNYRVIKGSIILV